MPLPTCSWYLWLVALFLAVLSGSSQVSFAEDYNDPSGFTLSCPEGWMPVSGAIVASKRSSMPAHVVAFLNNSKFDFSKLNVIILNSKADPTFTDNMNVVRLPTRMVVNQRMVSELQKSLPGVLSQSGIRTEGLQVTIQKSVTGRDQIVVNYRSQMPITPHKMAQRITYIPGRTTTFVFSCTSRADQFELSRPAFDAIEQSLKSADLTSPTVEASTGSGISTGGILRGALVGGLVGGVCGAFGGLGWYLANQAKSKKKSLKRKPRSRSFDEDDE